MVLTNVLRFFVSLIILLDLVVVVVVADVDTNDNDNHHLRKKKEKKNHPQRALATSEEFAAARGIAKQTWDREVASTNLEYSYWYQETNSNENKGLEQEPLRVIVKDGIAVSALPTFYNDIDHYPVPALAEVGDMLSFISSALQSDDMEVTSLSFDETYGYPTEFSVNFLETGQTFAVTAEDMALYSVLQQDLNNAMTLWSGASDYTYTIQVSCFCFPLYTSPKRITIINGEIDTVVEAGDGTAAMVTEYPTIEGLFGLIQTAIDEQYIKIDVTYDETYGYPTSIAFDISTRIADDETWYYVSDVVF